MDSSKPRLKSAGCALIEPEQVVAIGVGFADLQRRTTPPSGKVIHIGKNGLPGIIASLRLGGSRSQPL
jgi:hypothetical protein